MPRSGPEYGDDLRQGVDYFEVLGVDETASAEEVVAAFRARIKAVHPDLNGGKHDPEAVGRIARARKTLTGADREAYTKARKAHRDAAEPRTAPPQQPAPGAAGDVWGGPEARAWRWAAEEVRRRAEAEARSQNTAKRAASPPPRTDRPAARRGSVGPGSWATGGPTTRAGSDQAPRRPSSPASRSTPSPWPAGMRPNPTATVREKVAPTFPRRRAPMEPPRSRTPDEILRNVQRRSAEILDEARWRSEEAITGAQRMSHDILDVARRKVTSRYG